jgi:23S rRNA (cytosine1962-C5)-methyltransferase
MGRPSITNKPLAKKQHQARGGAARLRIRLTAAAETIIRKGHPWVFADSVRDQNRPGTTGELAVIYDRKDEFLAVGLYDADSPIRVRVLHAGKPVMLDDAWWTARLETAVARRDGLFGADTTGCRFINGESEGWPGLVLDRYGGTLVLKLYTAAWLPRLDAIAGLIAARFNGCGLVLRLSRNIQEIARGKFKNTDGQIVAGPALDGPLVFLETGLRLEADVLRGQKTGFFLDQRENRRLAEGHAAGRRVLNAFSFTGGFSVYCARGGALEVTDLDISRHALEGSIRNFALNKSVPGLFRCRHETIQADAFEWLAAAKQSFDLVILDPPSLAKREIERAGAIQAYEKLAGQGIRCLNRGGILLAASCSAHVSAEEFFGAVRSAATKSGKSFHEIRTTRHAPDHPATIPEAEYLKGIYLGLD